MFQEGRLMGRPTLQLTRYKLFKPHELDSAPAWTSRHMDVSRCIPILFPTSVRCSPFDIRSIVWNAGLGNETSLSGYPKCYLDSRLKAKSGLVSLKSGK